MNEVFHKHQRYPPSFSRRNSIQSPGIDEASVGLFFKAGKQSHFTWTMTATLGSDDAFGKWQELWKPGLMGLDLKHWEGDLQRTGRWFACLPRHGLDKGLTVRCGFTREPQDKGGISQSWSYPWNRVLLRWWHSITKLKKKKKGHLTTIWNLGRILLCYEFALIFQIVTLIL